MSRDTWLKIMHETEDAIQARELQSLMDWFKYPVQAGLTSLDKIEPNARYEILACLRRWRESKDREEKDEANWAVEQRRDAVHLVQQQ
jgi:hypothetical protein